MAERAAPLRGVLAYVALGANLGDRLATLRAAIRRLDETPGARVLRVSSVWETAAVGPSQPDYLNAVIELDVCRSPGSFLGLLHAIEAEFGRDRSREVRWGPRPLDLDLLWQGGLVLRGPRLDLPHPRIRERSFVLAPFAELAPDLVLHGRRIGEWLADRPEEERRTVRRLGALVP